MPDLRQTPPPDGGLFTPPDVAPASQNAPQGRETTLAGNLARASHPESSHMAAKSILPHLSSLEDWAAKCVTETPGKTRRELAELHCPDDGNMIGRRLDGCVKKGRLRRGPLRKCSVSGEVVQTWWPVEKES